MLGFIEFLIIEKQMKTQSKLKNILELSPSGEENLSLLGYFQYYLITDNNYWVAMNPYPTRVVNFRRKYEAHCDGQLIFQYLRHHVLRNKYSKIIQTQTILAHLRPGQNLHLSSRMYIMKPCPLKFLKLSNLRFQKFYTVLMILR